MYAVREYAPYGFYRINECYQKKHDISRRVCNHEPSKEICIYLWQKILTLPGKQLLLFLSPEEREVGP